MQQSEIPVLHTPRLILKKITENDHENIYKGLSHPEVIKHYGVNYSSFEETEEQMNWYSNLEKSGSGMWWKITAKEDGIFCGAIGFNDLNEEHKKAEIGFWLLPEFWGKGFIKEAAEIVIQFLFTNLDIHRLEAFVESENRNSAKVLKKLGFDFEGRMKDCEIKNGEFIIVDLFAKLNPH